MRRDVALGGLLVAVLVLSVLSALAVPGALAERREEPPDGFVRLSEITISDGAVGGETVELRTDVRLANRGGVSENVSVEFRAVGTDSGIVETSRTVEVGRVSDRREVPVVTNLTVGRGSDYRIEAIVYQDGQRLDAGDRTVRGIDSLTPAYAETGVSFHRFAIDDMPAIEYSIGTVADNRTTLDVSTFLTNRGATPSGELRVVLKARQVDSNIVADRTEVRLDGIGPGQTATPSASLTVPSSYNYYLDAVLYSGGVVVGTARSGASLDPTETVEVNTTRRDVGLEVGDFETDGGDDGRRDGGDRETETPSESGPGFGIGVAAVAILLALVARAHGGETHD